MTLEGFRTLRDVAVAHAARDPSAPFLIAPDNAHEAGRVLTYGELLRQAKALAGHLGVQGLRAGDKVGLLLSNGYQTAALFLGAMIAGFVIAPMNLRGSRSGLAYALDHCDCKILFTAKEQSAQLADAMALVSRKFAIETIDIDAARLFPDAQDAAVLEPLDADDPALLMYTSGTTGTPKGVLLTHRNLIAAAASVAQWHELRPADRVLSSLPLYHINGQVIGTLTPFLSGGSIVAPHGFSVTNWWRDVETYRCTWINMVPTIIAYLLNAAEAGARRRFPRLRFGRSASAPLPPEQHRAFEERFGVPVIEA
ncbi:MAG: AMP-binding protein, partial [Hyphomicrobiales bacterium]